MKRLICQNVDICPVHQLYAQYETVSGRKVLDTIEFEKNKYSCMALDWLQERDWAKKYSSLEGGFVSDNNQCGLIELLNNQAKILRAIENIGLGE